MTVAITTLSADRLAILRARFAAKIERIPFSECWYWTAGGHRYGQFWIGRPGRFVPAHVFSYETTIGPVSDGLELDHLCRTTLCVNPRHLEPVTHRMNILRGAAPTARNARKTHCPSGHPLSGENLLSQRRPTGQVRRCRMCHSAQRRAATKGGVFNGIKRQCPRGHAYDAENTGIRRLADGSFRNRYCRSCRLERAAAESRRLGRAPRHGFETHCPKGHAYDEANTYRNPRTGGRSCRVCHRESEAARRACVEPLDRVAVGCVAMTPRRGR